MTERWIAVAGFDDYAVSDLGRVRRGARILKPSAAGNGYRKITLRRNGESAHRYVHHMVLTAFVGPRPQGMEAAHYNGQRDDNRAANLRWDTRSGNHADKERHGTGRGENHGRRKLTQDQAIAIREAPGTCREIGDRFGVGPMQVSRIKTGKNWRHL